MKQIGHYVGKYSKESGGMLVGIPPEQSFESAKLVAAKESSPDIKTVFMRRPFSLGASILYMLGHILKLERENKI